MTEEMYEMLGFEGVLNEQKWVEFDPALCVDAAVEIVVQVNGKIRAKMSIPVDTDKDEVIRLAMAEQKIADELSGKNVLKQVYVPNKLVNFVAK